MWNEKNAAYIARHRNNEKGAALATALLMMAVLAAVAMSVLAVVSSEVRIAGSDLQRTQTFYASAAGIEKMTSDFSALFSRTSRPSNVQLASIAAAAPTELVNEGFTLNQTIEIDNTGLAAMRASQGITGTAYPQVTIPSGPYAGLSAAVAPWVLNTTATSRTGAQVTLRRRMNNYLIPIFQFGMFSNEDLEFHPGPLFNFNGRIHANGNLYLSGNVKFLDKVTTANEIVRDIMRNGNAHDANVQVQVGATTTSLTLGSVIGGPRFVGASPGQRGYFPDAAVGVGNGAWTSTSTSSAQTGVPNRFGGQVQTRTTGITALLLPMQLDGNPTREIIKRRLPNDDSTLSSSRYHSKAQIRILLDNETGSDAAGIPAGRGVLLSQFTPIPMRALCEIAKQNNGNSGQGNQGNGNGNGNAFGHSKCLKQGADNGPEADTVRGIRSTAATSSNGVTIPAGAGITGRILIEIVSANGTAYDVTTQILSMGMTEGEPNGIVYLQRPLWAAYAQGSRDVGNKKSDLVSLMGESWTADGEIRTTGGYPVQDATYGYLSEIKDDDGKDFRENAPGAAGTWNSIVPINIYNVREGRITTSLDSNTVYERGIMSVIDINMRNLARWVDGDFDTTLLAGTNAVSTNIEGNDGYIIYISDRRGDKIKSERDPTGAVLSMTNGMVDNEDIYGWNNVLDAGEDVIDAGFDFAKGANKKGTLQKDTTELPDPAALAGTSGTDRLGRAKTVAAWANASNYFRRSVRLLNGEDLQISGDTDKLSSTKGLTMASENMIYIWGNYNTTGINGQPSNGATLNDPSQSNRYLGNQVPASIVADAITPLSRTWFDALSSIYPDDLGKRHADNGASVSQETSVRAAIIAGNNLGALAGSPDAGNSSAGESRLNGGMHNFPRFLENWDNNRWNYVGSLIPLYHSTQAVGPYNANSSIYSPPIRNWAFDTTFRDPNRLPPGTPQFQYIEPTAFRQVL